MLEINFPCKWSQETEWPVLYHIKLTFNQKLPKNKEGHFILVKGKVYQDDLSILNIYALNARPPTFIKETLLKLNAYIAPHTIRVGEIHTTLSTMNKSERQELNRDTVQLTEVLEQKDLTDTYRTFHPKAK